MEGQKSFHFFISVFMKKLFLFSFVFISFGTLFAQSTSYWQQHVDYKMDVVMDVKNYQYKGTQELVYTNNSPDTLKRVFPLMTTRMPASITIGGPSAVPMLAGNSTSVSLNVPELRTT